MTALSLTPEISKVFDEPEYRIEGPLKVSGRARYAADVTAPGVFWAKFLVSPRPHARIVSIDTTAAKAVPGVHAVLTGEDIGRKRFGRMLFDWPVLAFDRVIFAGQRVAAVAAETKEAAEEAINLIEVEYEDLPVIVDPEDALKEGAPPLHPDAATYTYLGGERTVPHPNLQGYELFQKGDPDIEHAFAQADRVFEDVYETPRQHQGYIEPHACMVWIRDDGSVYVRSTNKSPFGLRRQLSIVTGIPQEQIDVDSRFIGGDFGGKGNSIDEWATYFLAKATGRPVKAVMSYAEELAGVNPRHMCRIYTRTGVMNDGKIVAFASRAYYNGGACAGAKPQAGLVVGTGFGTMQVYNIPNTRMEVFVSYTNTVPCGNMRAPGVPVAALAGEEQIDHIARELGIDPFEIRLKNALREGDHGPKGEELRNPQAVAVLEALRREVRWGERPLPPNRGRGIALRHREGGEGKTEIVLRLMPDGQIDALYGTPDQGSGSATLVRRIAAAILTVDPNRIAVRYGTTGEAKPDPGAGASRVTHVMGRATINGALRMKDKLEELAAEVMGWPAGEVHLQDDRFVVGDGSAESASFEQVADRIARGGPIEIVGQYDSSVEHTTEDTSFYAYMIEVEVDPETGHVKPLEAVMTVDVGPIINPVAHQGQLDGSFVYGLGNTMMEELEIDDEGKVSTLSLGEYKMPTQMDTIPLRTVLIPTEIGPGPFGAKAVGETVNAGVHPAIANAIRDAIGVRIKTFPITSERVYRAIQEQHGKP
jgi:CO/xanthine dehydrogenase Mo-binding subunit